MMQMAKYAIYISSNITRCSVVWQMGHPSRRNENLCDIRSKYISLSIPFSRGIRFGLFLAPFHCFCLPIRLPLFPSLCVFFLSFPHFSLCMSFCLFSVFSFLFFCFAVLLSLSVPLLRSIFLSSSLSPTFYALLSLSSFSLFICLFLFLFLCLFCSSFSVAIIFFFLFLFLPESSIPYVSDASLFLCVCLYLSLYISRTFCVISFFSLHCRASFSS